MKAKGLSLSLIILIAFLVWGCSRARKQAAVVPPPPPPPPTSLAQDLPLPRVAVPPLLERSLQPEFDMVSLVIERADRAFRRGEKEYGAGHMEAAKREFNAAIEEILQAPVTPQENKRLSEKFDFLVARIHTYELEALKQGDGFTEQFYEPAPLDEMATLTFPDVTDSGELGERVWADAANTVSDLPLVINKRVKSLIQYFCCSRRGRRALEAGLRRSGRFRDMIVRILEEEGMPRDLLYLAQAESGFRPLARSRAGATGLWQFMRFRGREYGLERNWWMDERLNPEKATRAAARHLKDLYNEFGDWYLAMAAYNCGPVCVQRAIRRTRVKDFWKLAARRRLPRQTRNYVPIILALIVVSKNPQKYGIEDLLPEPPLVYDAVTVTHPVDLRLVSEIVGSSLKTLRELNPSLLRTVTPKVPEYNLRIPVATKSLFLRRIAMIPPEKRVWWRWHTVRYGETLSGIAKKYRTSLKAIAEVNNVDPQQPLQESAELVIPVTRGRPPGEGRHRVRRGETLSLIARRYNVSVTQLMAWNQLNSTVIRAGATLLVGPGSPPPGQGAHRVRRGETLSLIARRYNVSVNQLRAWNHLRGTMIRAGSTLAVVPPGSSTASAPRPVRSASRRTARRPARIVSTRKKSAAPRGVVVHRVRKGESLWKIATNYHTSVEVLKRNNSHLGRILQPGDRVVIPPSN